VPIGIYQQEDKDGEFAVLVAIRIGGKDVVGMIPRERYVGMVFQNYALFPHMNVLGNMARNSTINRRTGLSPASLAARL